MPSWKKSLALLFVLWAGLVFTAPGVVAAKTSAPQPAAAQAQAKMPGKPININTASAEQLQELNGIGPSLSKKIVDYRKKNGPFKTPQDLMKVPGIGEKTLEKNLKYIKVK